jgi:hypothetical protein
MLKFSLRYVICGVLFTGMLAFAVHATPPAAPAPDFNREVRPVLSNHCFQCHGPDDKQRAAGLRLDFGLNKAKQIEVLKRITATDAAVRMPPPTAHKPLTPAKIATLRNWIASGARYAPHWAFVAPTQAPLPAVKNLVWAKNPIDRFVRAKMAKSGWPPNHRPTKRR